MMKSPKEMAGICANGGLTKGTLPIDKMFLLAILAGMFIAFGGAGSTIAGCTVESGSIGKLLGACVFPGGLAMVLLAGAELFTGNCLMIVAVMEKKITPAQMIRNWVVVYFGNMVGGIFVAATFVYSHMAGMFNGQLAQTMVNTATAKANMGFMDGVLRGILCNILVCLAVWMSYAAIATVGKVTAIFFPIMIFVACGFEHCVANMYFIPAGLFASSVYAIDAPTLTWGGFFITNLIPVTIGNIIGGAGLGLMYWAIYLKGAKEA